MMRQTRNGTSNILPDQQHSGGSRKEDRISLGIVFSNTSTLVEISDPFGHTGVVVHLKCHMEIKNNIHHEFHAVRELLNKFSSHSYNMKLGR